METKNDGYVVINDRTCFAVHPGEILQAELKERKIKQKDFARSIGMQPSHLSALIHGVRSVTPAIAAKLEKRLGIPASLWNNLQTKYVADCIRLKEKRDEAAGKKSPEGQAPVKTYPVKQYPMRALADPVGPPCEKLARVMLTLEASDLEWLEFLADRMGWGFKEV